MADEPVESQETTEQTSAPESPTEAPATTESEPSSETSTETTAPESTKWDKDRQLIDQERANLRKERERLEADRAEIERAKSAAPTSPAPAPEPSDIAKAESLIEEADKLDDEDPFNASKKRGEAQKLIIKHQKAQDAARQFQEQQQAAHAAYWSDFEKKNPTIPVSEAQKIVDTIADRWRKAGLTGQALATVVNGQFEEAIIARKKSPATPSTTQVKKPATTAAPARGNAPVGKVVPSNSGARQQPVQQAEAKKRLLEMFDRP
jgi:hypothetical protein